MLLVARISSKATGRSQDFAENQHSADKPPTSMAIPPAAAPKRGQNLPPAVGRVTEPARGATLAGAFHLLMRPRCRLAFMSQVDRLALWDFDGTLGHRPGMWSQALVESLTLVDPDHGYTITDVQPFLATGFPWHSQTHRHPYAGKPDAWWDYMATVFRGAYTSMGCSDDLAIRASAQVQACYLDASTWRIYPDSKPSLDRLADAGWSSSIVSNHVPELPQLLDELDIADRFQHIVSSGSYGHEKPSTAIFEHALQLAGSPRIVHMIGDSPTADIAGAERAGITGHLVERRIEEPGTEPGPLFAIIDRILALRD